MKKKAAIIFAIMIGILFVMSAVGILFVATYQKKPQDQNPVVKDEDSEKVEDKENEQDAWEETVKEEPSKEGESVKKEPSNATGTDRKSHYEDSFRYDHRGYKLRLGTDSR